MKRAISVTLDADNVTWLKGRAGAAGESVSEVIDKIVTHARQTGHFAHPRSVVGTIEISPADPLLREADTTLRSMFETSVSRPFLVRETTRRSRPSKRRG